MKWSTLAKVAIYVFLISAGLIFIYPLLYIVLGSFTTQAEYLRTRYIPMPGRIRLSEYRTLFELGGGELVPALRVTLIREAWFITLGVVVSLLGGYAFSRLRFPGRDFLFMVFLTGLMVPGMLISLPVYMIMVHFPLAGGNNILGMGGEGFLNSWGALLVLGMIPVFSVFLLKQNFDMLPFEYEEAAVMDGAGLFTILFRIYVPMLKPVLVVIIVQTFIGTWNEYFMPMLLVARRADLTPLAVALQRMIARYAMAAGQGVGMPRFGLIFASGTLMCAPPILLYVLMQRYFVQGLVGIGIRA
ncbi:MAG TPA: carbohydrate ABC transporter permease [Anaerolineae bacterium]|nr:carbohydrate ABC transporter permease [Anaerolineae bacterium]